MVDVIILVILALFFLGGFKRGVLKEAVVFIGLIIVIVLAFYLKNPLAVVMYENLPFFNFDGIFKGVTILNILLYEVLAFFIVFSVLFVVLKIVTFVTGIVEKVLTFTIILGIPSKILGGLLGLCDGIAVVFIALYILTLPNFQFTVVNDSVLKNQIMNNTPILGSFTDETFIILNEVYAIKDKYDNTDDPSKLNYETLDLLLKYKIVSVDSVYKLDEKGKINIPDIEVLLEKYDK